MKFYLATFIFLLIAISSYAQRIISLFRLLPLDCTPELNTKEKDILLRKGEYIIPGGDSLETVKYTIDTTESENSLRYEYSFTTGQRAFIVFEIRKFVRSNRKSFLIFSRYGGSPAAYDQHELRIFTIQNNRLIVSKEKLLPEKAGIKNFLKKNTPDSTRVKIESNVSIRYDLNPEIKNGIALRLFRQTSNDEYEKYILGHVLLFTWTGLTFSRKIVNELE